MADRTDMQRQNPDIPRLLGILAVILILVVASFARNRVWDSKLSLWSDVAEKSGGKSRAHNNLGNCYMLLERPFKAVEEYKAAIALDADNIEAYYNLAMNLEKVGLLGRGSRVLRSFLPEGATRSINNRKNLPAKLRRSFPSGPGSWRERHRAGTNEDIFSPLLRSLRDLPLLPSPGRGHDADGIFL